MIRAPARRFGSIRLERPASGCSNGWPPLGDSPGRGAHHSFGLQPHRSEPVKLSTDPRLAEKMRDIVGL